MAYMPGFSYDLFVSYAGANLDGELKDYLTGVRSYLKQESGSEFPDKGNVFFDREILNSSPVEWKEKLRASGQSAALLVPILSPGYDTADYCAVRLRCTLISICTPTRIRDQSNGASKGTWFLLSRDSAACGR